MVTRSKLNGLTGSLYGALLCAVVVQRSLIECCVLCDKKEKLSVCENFGKEQNLGLVENATWDFVSLWISPEKSSIS